MRAAWTLKRSVSTAASIAIAFVSANAITQPVSAAATENDIAKQIEKAPEIPNVDHLLNDSSTATSKPCSAAPMAEPTDANTCSESPTNSSADAPTAQPAPPAIIPAKAIAKPAGKPMSQIDQVKSLYRAGKYRDALAVIAKMKQSDLTYYYTGLCYQGQGQLTQAAQAFSFTASVAKDPVIKYNAAVAQRAVASYASRRTYSGQGNNFAAATAAYRQSGGGGGAVRRG